jgi:hypothetical protein
MLGEHGKLLIERLRARTTRTKTPVLAIIFRVPMTSVSPYLNPPYLCGIVAYEDDQTAIFHSNFALIHFPFSKIFFRFHLHPLLYDDVMITPPQQASI